MLADMAESLGQQRLAIRAERVTLVNFLEAGIRLLLDSSLEVRTNQMDKCCVLKRSFQSYYRASRLL